MILCDGMRPDAVLKCGHPFAEKLMSISYYNPHAQTVFPSWTLPCHMSLFIIFGKIVTTLYKDNKNTEQKQEKRDLFNIFNIVEQCTQHWRQISYVLSTIVLNIEYIFANVLFNGLFPCPNTFNKYRMHV